MEQSVLFPSPNWFQPSGMTVSCDGWILYGGPSKSLCIIHPKSSEDGTNKETNLYDAHVLTRAHPEKIICVDLHPEWPLKRGVLSGSYDGLVKHWNLEYIDSKLKVTTAHIHNIHSSEKEEVVGVGYSSNIYAITVGCYGNIVKWNLNSNITTTQLCMKSFRPSCMKCSPHNELIVAVGTKQGVICVLNLNGQAGEIMYKVRAHDDEIVTLSWCPQFEVHVKKILKDSASLRLANTKIVKEPAENNLSLSTKENDISNETQDETVKVELEDLFDVYKDHQPDEFGHKKYQSEEILVKVDQGESKKLDFLEECRMLKNDIIERKNATEPSINTLVEAFEKTHVSSGEPVKSNELPKQCNYEEGIEDKNVVENEPAVSVDTGSYHVHRHLLASIGKFGNVRIWSKSGKLISSCTVLNTFTKSNKQNRSLGNVTLFWYSPNILLLSDGKSCLLECNPLEIDCKNKLEWKQLHNFHKRGLYCIASGVPRKLISNNDIADFPIWTVAQDRNIIQYSYKERQVIQTYNTCGGFVYMIAACPYDAEKLALAVGDGAVRIWSPKYEDSKLHIGNVTSYWQNVQGKVLTVAWHPTKENLLAFSTAEGRVGLIDANIKSEKPAKVLPPVFSNGVYSLCWGERYLLYACGGGELYIYRANKIENAPESLHLQFEGRKWNISEVIWYERALCVGTSEGSIGVLTPKAPHVIVAAAFPYTKSIYQIAWHPQQISSSNDESQYKNMIAVCSADKFIVIMEIGEKEDGNIKLSVLKNLSGHKGSVTRVQWNPHRDSELLSSSSDATVKVWNVLDGSCISMFTIHPQTVLMAAWCPQPEHADYVLSGGGDYCLRLWNIRNHSPVQKTSVLEKDNDAQIVAVRKERKRNRNKNIQNDDVKEPAVVPVISHRLSRKFLLPIVWKQTASNNVNGCRKLFNKYMCKNLQNAEENPVITNTTEKSEDDYNTDYIKIFGNINEVNEILDIEQDRHLESQHYDAWLMIGIIRGEMDKIMQFASSNNIITPFLLSIAPCVSYKFWKDSMQLYLAQIDRLLAKEDQDKLFEIHHYGGPALNKAAVLLAVHDVKGAVGVLCEASLYKDAYVVCRVRHADSLAVDTLRSWAKQSCNDTTYALSASCYIVLGELEEAVAALSKSKDEKFLSLAADIAKVTGQATLADHIIERNEAISNSKSQTTEPPLPELPKLIDLMTKVNIENGENSCVIKELQ